MFILELSQSEFNFSTRNQFNDEAHDLAKTNNHKQNQLLVNSNPVLLLTPSPSYLALLNINIPNNNLSPSSHANHFESLLLPMTGDILKSKNIVIESSILYLSQFKKLVALLLNSIESNFSQSLTTQNDMRFNNSNIIDNVASQSIISFRCLHSDISFFHSKSYHRSFADYWSLDALMDKMSCQPKSLKVLSRRSILNQLITIQKKQNLENNDNRTLLIKNQVLKLPLPKRMQNYLLFINN